MKLVQSILTKNPCYTAGRKITVKGLMLHSVGCPQPKASVFINSWNSPSYDNACVHGFIDGNDGTVYQTLMLKKSHNNKNIKIPCIPYGYRIENGRTVIDEEQAATVRDFFQNYISGMALMPAAEKVGLNLYHGSAGRMLRNKKYLGDDYYPAIIDKETFDKAEEIRMSRAKALGRVWELEGKKDILFPTNFTIPAVKKVSDDPFEQAAYAYSLIESEVDMGGTE